MKNEYIEESENEDKDDEESENENENENDELKDDELKDDEDEILDKKNKKESYYFIGIPEPKIPKNDGEYNEYYKRNICYTETRKNEKIEGIVQSYFNNSKLQYKYMYKNNKKHGKSINYYESDKEEEVIELERNFNHGELDGEQIAYYRNKQIKYRIYYTNGIPTGTWTYYYNTLDNQLDCIMNYNKDGKLHGIQIGYYKKNIEQQEQQQLRYKEEYYHGILHSGTYYSMFGKTIKTFTIETEDSVELEIESELSESEDSLF
jgi:antitoxin component YwqK of YwqJK toxin-antitoxin module